MVFSDRRSPSAMCEFPFECLGCLRVRCALFRSECNQDTEGQLQVTPNNPGGGQARTQNHRTMHVNHYNKNPGLGLRRFGWTKMMIIT